MKKIFIACVTALLLIGLFVSTQGQTDNFHPKGDPDKWNVELTPFLWLPAIGGELNSQVLTEDFNIPAVDLLEKLKMAFMFTGEVSKGKFFFSPTYFYSKLGTEEVLWTSPIQGKEVKIAPDIKLNILDMVAGMRFRVNDNLVFDPYLGVRYSNYKVLGTLEGILDSNEFEESSDFWDPIIGFQMYYFPHPRVPIRLKTDIGGFGVGSQLSWMLTLNSGYTLSPSFDLLAGLTAYGANYESESPVGNTVGLDVVMYGLNLGVAYHIPVRSKDKEVFKKFE